MLTRLVSLFQEKVENRYYGKYRAVVTDNEDPEMRGRLMVHVPSLLGETEIGWAMPCLPYGGGADLGFYMVPEAGDGVWVEFEAGRISYPIWSGTWWAREEGPQGAEGDDPAPARKLIKTAGGHLIQLDDSDGSESITILDKDGNLVKMNAEAIEINADTRDVNVSGNNVTVEATTQLDLTSATINIEGSGTVTITGATVDLNP
ncbi:hypothetical protein D1AOALGA4SA_8267 [Olavius algarvensis Delta 1 endosymbiont]|nr:hypothetical protein D1AOALGA4SA_8267 [Olavius algarvensis Delta 1 endosymbiont]